MPIFILMKVELFRCGIEKVITTESLKAEPASLSFHICQVEQDLLLEGLRELKIKFHLKW